MGLVIAEITLENPRELTLQPIESESYGGFWGGALCIPEHVTDSTGAEEIDKKEVTLADGGRKSHLVYGSVLY